jgi:hypothetical protein
MNTQSETEMTEVKISEEVVNPSGNNFDEFIANNAELIHNIRNNIFGQIDKESVSPKEIHDAIKNTIIFLRNTKYLSGAEKGNVVEYVTTQLVNEIPKSNNEFLEIIRLFAVSALPGIIKNIYFDVIEYFDTNNDGSISCQECKTGMNRMCCCMRR